MLGRLLLVALAFAAGIAVASMAPSVPQSVRKITGLAGEQARSSDRKDADDEKKGVVKLTAEQMATAKIELAQAESGVVLRRIIAPGTVVPAADRIARVAVKLSGTVAELRKKLGDSVLKDEVLAVLESREVADAKSEYLAARLTQELQQDLFERDKALWDKRVSTEQQFLRSRNLAAQAGMRLNIARQKLFALGLAQEEIVALPNEPEALLRRQEVRSPMAGRVVERKVDLGTAVGRDNLETELFVIADLSHVWVEVSVSPADLPTVKESQPAQISARGIAERAEGKVIFISPMIERDSRSAHAVVQIDNSDGVWRPGSFVAAAIAIGEHAAAIAVPAGAIQTVADEKVVFVRIAEGFEKRVVVIGRSDDRLVEITAGLEAADNIAVSNTFLLKAELLKSSAEE
jgi:membrane fusion protein, heavy metal efflux system